jgi:hypothetical protein
MLGLTQRQSTLLKAIALAAALIVAGQIASAKAQGPQAHGLVSPAQLAVNAFAAIGRTP